MHRHFYEFAFREHILIADIDELLTLAIVAVEGTHGPARLRLDGRFWIDTERRMVFIDAHGGVGKTLNEVFTHFVTNAHGDDAFDVRRVQADLPVTASEGAVSP